MSDRFVKREEDADLPRLTSDEELLAWSKGLSKARPKRRKQLVAEPARRKVAYRHDQPNGAHANGADPAPSS